MKKKITGALKDSLNFAEENAYNSNNNKCLHLSQAGFNYSFFSKIDKNLGDLKNSTWHDFIAEIREHRIYENKDSAPLFSAFRYENNKRNNENALSSSMAIFDFDDLKGFDAIKEIQENLNKTPSHYPLFSTHSFNPTGTKPKLSSKLLIPFKEEFKDLTNYKDRMEQFV